MKIISVLVQVISAIIFFIIFYFIHGLNKHWYTQYSLGETWTYFIIVLWIVMQVIILFVNIGKNAILKLSIQLTFTLLLIFTDNAVLSVVYFREQGIFEVVPISTKYAMAPFILISFVILVILLRRLEFKGKGDVKK
jgi:hypothetical protein